MSNALRGRHLFLFGPGYTARETARLAMAEGAVVSATARNAAAARGLTDLGIRPWLLEQAQPLPVAALDGVTDLLVSAPPRPEGCPIHLSAQRALGPGGRLEDLRWIGYYSSSAVYGDCGGAWIDERQPPDPIGIDAKARLRAEADWRIYAATRAASLDIFRIAGIYGPEGRNLLGQLRAGTARAILKPGQVFNRIHRDDIARATLCAMRAPDGVRLTNLADGAPCAASEVLLGLADMLGLPAPPSVDFDAANLPQGAATFYAENRRLRIDALQALPGFILRFADWRAGYADILARETVPA